MVGTPTAFQSGIVDAGAYTVGLLPERRIPKYFNARPLTSVEASCRRPCLYSQLQSQGSGLPKHPLDQCIRSHIVITTRRETVGIM